MLDFLLDMSNNSTWSTTTKTIKGAAIIAYITILVKTCCIQKKIIVTMILCNRISN